MLLNDELLVLTCIQHLESGFVILPALAALLVAVIFVHDRILLRMGVRHAEPAAVTVRRALQELVVWMGEMLLLILLFLPFFFFWSWIAVLTGIRAAAYQNYPVAITKSFGGLALSISPAWFIRSRIIRHLGTTTEARGRAAESDSCSKMKAFIATPGSIDWTAAFRLRRISTRLA